MVLVTGVAKALDAKHRALVPFAPREKLALTVFISGSLIAFVLEERVDVKLLQELLELGVVCDLPTGSERAAELLHPE